MNLTKNNIQGLNTLKRLIGSLSQDRFILPRTKINNRSVGESVREVLELQMCLITGIYRNQICYNMASRFSGYEQDQQKSMGALDDIVFGLSHLSEDKKLSVRLKKNGNPFPDEELSSSVRRELAYLFDYTRNKEQIIRYALSDDETVDQGGQMFQLYNR